MIQRFGQLTLHTKPKQFGLGRRLYTGHLDQQKYWLKAQLLHADPTSSTGFFNELSFYRNLNTTAQFILPMQIIEIGKINSESIIPQVLVVPHADYFLKEQVSGLSLSQIKDKIEKMLDVLALLHQTGYMHGDLKPEHFVMYQQQLHLIDFEHSQQISSDYQQGIQDQQSIQATPRYMAPELFHGECKSIQSDLYALGIILYEWLSQQRLEAQTYQQWAVLHCQQLQIQPNHQLESFVALLDGLLQKRKISRFSDIEQVKNALHSIE
ncbi:protein kinase domain-containing protein [Acinetobacter ihumii]|uniref:protein kinase domain-containing protein n=1 Tax=Acinetobacter ihumii TaxID=2483802 RepID=UPI001031256E|nr:protein kinase [Acinetobacter ihumii]